MSIRHLIAALGLAAIAGYFINCGDQGPQGPAGLSCTVKQTPEGVIIICPDGSVAIVKHGRGCNHATCEGK